MYYTPGWFVIDTLVSRPSNVLFSFVEWALMAAHMLTHGICIWTHTNVRVLGVAMAKAGDNMTMYLDMTGTWNGLQGWKNFNENFAKENPIEICKSSISSSCSLFCNWQKNSSSKLRERERVRLKASTAVDSRWQSPLDDTRMNGL